MEDLEIPQYFICPISLQIMRDPVTATTGITYDRESIEYWMLTAEDSMCPVTKQLLPRDSDMTPNHTLRRLIQAWCIANADYGIDRIPTPRSPPSRSYVLKLLREINITQLYRNSLEKLDFLVNENERNKKCMVEAGIVKAMVSFVVKSFKEGQTTGLEEAFRILQLTWTPVLENKHLVNENMDLIDSIIWVLGHDSTDVSVAVKSHAVIVLRMIIDVACSSLLERLNLVFFTGTVNLLRENKSLSQQATKAVLHVLIDVCPWGRNRIKIVEANAIFELVELELENSGKGLTELVFILLAHLCSCADGRAQLLKHAGGIAMLTKRTLRASPATDDRAVHIFSLIARFSATNEVLLEMLRVGAVSKLCMVMQADCATYMKKQAREILRLHSNAWNNSPCIAVYLVTRYRDV